MHMLTFGGDAVVGIHVVTLAGTVLTGMMTIVLTGLVTTFFTTLTMLTPVDCVGDVPLPCCFPAAFQATVADLRSVSTDMRLYEVYRDWEKRLQVQRIMSFAPPGQLAPTTTVILDFKNMTQYVITASGDCQPRPLDYAMLEPCIPEDALYLGKSYLGFRQHTAGFQAWSFTRTDQGRDIAMTVAVTPGDCVPLMETITGTLGQARTDSLVMFTAFKELEDRSVFHIPPNCFSGMM